MPSTTDSDPTSFASYRRALLSASVPWTAGAVLVATLVFQLGVLVTAPTRFAVELLPNLLQLAIPALGWALFRGPLRRHPGAILQAGDLLYTAMLIVRLALPTTTVSGTALYLAVKMLVCALLIPWGVRVQARSVLLSLLMLFVGLFASGNAPGFGGVTHIWLGPLVAGVLSIAGAAAAERVRRAVHEREQALAASARHLKEEAAVEEALARVGRELIALPDTGRLLDRLCQLTTEVLRCDASHTFLWDAERDEYRVTAGFGDTPEQWETLRLVTYPLDLVRDFQRLLRDEGVLIYRLADTAVQASTVLQQAGTTVILCVALRRGDQLVGVLSAEYRRPEATFTPHQVRITRGMAHLASLALSTARLVEELDAANRLKSEFVATMSHELRSPLNIMIGYHELLLDGAFGPLTELQRDPLRRADRSARELLDLISATLDLSRLEARRIAIDITAVDVGELVDEVGREYAGLVERQELAVRWFASRDLPLLHTDRVKLKMVLKNLVGNAVKFTDAGQVSLDAAARDGGVEFVVSDTGVGIPPDYQAAIFEPFRQLEVSRSRLRGGAGLGLYIVRRLLDAIGGTIAVESELGRGSTFRVWVPDGALRDRAVFRAPD